MTEVVDTKIHIAKLAIFAVSVAAGAATGYCIRRSGILHRIIDIIRGKKPDAANNTKLQIMIDGHYKNSNA